MRVIFGRSKNGEGVISSISRIRASHPQAMVQALDADMVVSRRHLTSAVEKAMRAMAEGRNVANDPGMEILRYASGQRQIERALGMGVSAATRRIALIVLGELPEEAIRELMEIDGMGPAFDEEKVKEYFGITPEEIEAVGMERIPDLVLERVALVDAYR